MRTRGLRTNTSLSDPQLVGAGKESRLGQRLASVNQPEQAVCEPDKGRRAAIAVVYPSGLGTWPWPWAGSWVLWVGNSVWNGGGGRRKVVALGTGTVQTRPRLYFPCAMATLSPFIVDTFIFLKEGNSSTRKKAVDVQEYRVPVRAHCGHETDH